MSPFLDSLSLSLKNRCFRASRSSPSNRPVLIAVIWFLKTTKSLTISYYSSCVIHSVNNRRHYYDISCKLNPHTKPTASTKLTWGPKPIRRLGPDKWPNFHFYPCHLHTFEFSKSLLIIPFYLDVNFFHNATRKIGGKKKSKYLICIIHLTCGDLPFEDSNKLWSTYPHREKLARIRGAKPSSTKARLIFSYTGP